VSGPLLTQDSTTQMRTHVHASSEIRAVVLGGLVVIVIAIGPKIRRFIPDRGLGIFKGDKRKFVARLPLEGK
jgi:MFS superfamily sulfate permease-like transporter